jgi:hypothetical protein
MVFEDNISLTLLAAPLLHKDTHRGRNCNISSQIKLLVTKNKYLNCSRSNSTVKAGIDHGYGVAEAPLFFVFFLPATPAGAK